VATNYKVLGQSAPAATTATTLYTVPASTQAIVSTITVCNRATGTRTFRIAIRPDGTSIANQHYVAFDSTISANDTVALTLGVTLGDTDVITVYGSTNELTFCAFGAEVTP
jgi:glucose-6-phosphate dehydrogenase assembly protein OpcA